MFGYDKRLLFIVKATLSFIQNVHGSVVHCCVKYDLFHQDVMIGSEPNISPSNIKLMLFYSAARRQQFY
jgi:hypothetical protein